MIILLLPIYIFFNTNSLQTQMLNLIPHWYISIKLSFNNFEKKVNYLKNDEGYGYDNWA